MRFKMGDTDFVCIDWDERTLRIVDASLSRSGIKIRTAVQAPVPDGVNTRDPVAMSDLVRRTLGENRIRTRRAVLDIPRQDVILNRMTLPPGSMDELTAMVHMQIGKDLPFPKDQAIIDFAIGPKARDDGTLDVWVAAIRPPVLERYQQVVEGAGLKMLRVGFRPFANVQAIAAAGITEGRTLLVDVGAGTTEISVIRDGALSYTRAASVVIPDEGLLRAEAPKPVRRAEDDTSIPFADDVLAKPKPMDSLLVEVNRTIEAYRATDLGAKLDRIMLAGTVGVDDAVAQAFERRFGAPCEVWRVPDDLRWRGGDESGAPFVATIGSAVLSAEPMRQRFDFLHPKQEGAERRQKVKQRPMLVGTIALFLMAAGVVAYQPYRQRYSELEGLEAKIKQLNQDKESREEALAKVADLRTWNEDSTIWIDLLMKLAENFPSNQECFVTDLNLKDNGVIQVELVAVDEQVVTRVVEMINSIENEKGKTLFIAAPGNKPTSSNIPKYPVEDKVTVAIKDKIDEDERR